MSTKSIHYIIPGNVANIIRQSRVFPSYKFRILSHYEIHFSNIFRDKENVALNIYKYQSQKQCTLDG